MLFSFTWQNRIPRSIIPVWERLSLGRCGRSPCKFRAWGKRRCLSGGGYFIVEKLRFSDNMCSDFAEHESSESSHTETFSLQKYKNRGTRPRFLCVFTANAVLCALPRGCGRVKTSSIGELLSLRPWRGDFFGRKEGISRRFQPFTKNLFVYPL